ncbi:MAG: hypothetical protein ACTHM6_08570 [Tepidisphaeraceae bacterium]
MHAGGEFGEAGTPLDEAGGDFRRMDKAVRVGPRVWGVDRATGD